MWTFVKIKKIVPTLFGFSCKNVHSKPIFTNPVEAVKDIPSDSTILVGGFGMCGVPENLISALQKTAVRNLTVVSNNGGVCGHGLDLLLKNRQIKRMISSYIGENPNIERQYLCGELEIEFNPQGTLAERIRAGGAGIPGFYTRTGYGTLIHKGNCPIKHDENGKPILTSEPKETKEFNGKEYILESAIKGDFALIRAWKGDEAGNLIFRKTAQNFNCTMAKAAKCTLAEVEEVVPVGQIESDAVHLPGIYVDRILTGFKPSNYIEKSMVRQSQDQNNESDDPRKAARYRIAKRAAQELKDGFYVNVGIGIPTLLPQFISPTMNINIHSENGMLGVGPYPTKDQIDADLINAGKECITELPGASYFSSSESFEIVRGGHIDLTFLGAMQVSEYGNLSNWIIPGKLLKGMGGAMDLVSTLKTKVIIMMEHANQNGKPKIISNCTIPLTGTRCVDLIITELGVFSVDPNKGLTLLEIANNVTINDIKSLTEAKFLISPLLKPMNVN